MDINLIFESTFWLQVGTHYECMFIKKDLHDLQLRVIQLQRIKRTGLFI